MKQKLRKFSLRTRLQRDLRKIFRIIFFRCPALMMMMIYLPDILLILP